MMTIINYRKKLFVLFLGPFFWLHYQFSRCKRIVDEWASEDVGVALYEISYSEVTVLLVVYNEPMDLIHYDFAPIPRGCVRSSIFAC